MSKTLSAILKDSTAIVQAIIEGEGEIPAELELAQELNAAELALKTDQYGYVLDEIAFRIEFLKAKSAELESMRENLKKSSDAIEARMKFHMESFGLKEINGDETRFMISQNPPKVIIDNEAEIPNVYFNIPAVRPVLDKKAVAEALKSGTDVPGARVERGTRISRKLSTSKKVVGS